MQVVHKEATQIADYVVRTMRTADEQNYQHMPMFGWRKIVPGGHRHAYAWRKCSAKQAAACEAAWKGPYHRT